MSLYLYQRLLVEGSIPQQSLVAALTMSVRSRTSFIECLLVADLRCASVVMECFYHDGEKADPAWRPDPRLLLDLPPGLCEMYLAFPFRERAGAVEVATISPLDPSVRAEFSAHLSRPIALFRGGIQALLAAAGAPVDLRALSNSLSEPPFGGEGGPIPLVRKSQNGPKSRQRMRTAPGLGEEAESIFPSASPAAPSPVAPSSASPSSASDLWTVAPEERLGRARDPRELALALGLLLCGPSLIFEMRGGLMHLRAMSPGGGCDDSPVAVVADSGLGVAATSGRYLGPWYRAPIHERFEHVFREGELVQIDRIGAPESGLIVARRVTVDGRDDGQLMRRARTVWDQMKERATLFG